MHLLKLMRYKNLLIIVLTIILIKFFLIDSQIHTQSFFWTDFFLFLISTLCFTASGYVFNDIYDVKADIINKPKKFIVSKHISKRNVWILTIGLFLTGLTTGILASIAIDRIQNILLLLVPFFCVILYSIFFKRITILGNGIIAVCVFWIFPLVYSLICVGIPFLYFIYILWAAESKKEFTYLSKLLKTIMFFGILSMLFFKLN